MGRLPFEQQLAIAVQAVALAALAIRFLASGLFRIYPYFFSYLTVALVQTIILPFFSPSSRAYLYAWFATEDAIVFFYALIVLEEYSQILREMPGVATLARRYIKGTLGVVVVASLLLVAFEKTPATLPQYLLVCNRVVMSSLLGFVLLSVFFLAYYPIPVSRNVLIYSIGFAVYLLSKTTALFLWTMRMQGWAREANLAVIVVPTACLLFWLFTLTQRGEARTVILHRRWTAEDEQRILSKLHAINDGLVRTTKK